MPAHKKSEQQHRANNTYRPGQHAAPRLPVQVPPMPADLSPTAQAAWRVITENLRVAGIVSSIDGVMLRVLVEAIEQAVECGDHIRQHGYVTMTKNKAGAEYPCRNPAVAMKNAAWQTIIAVSRQFGLSPAARSGIPFEQQPETPEDAAEIARILKFDA